MIQISDNDPSVVGDPAGGPLAAILLSAILSIDVPMILSMPNNMIDTSFSQSFSIRIDILGMHNRSIATQHQESERCVKSRLCPPTHTTHESRDCFAALAMTGPTCHCEEYRVPRDGNSRWYYRVVPPLYNLSF